MPATIFCLDKPTYSPKVCETGKPQIYMAFYLVGQGQPLMEVCLSPMFYLLGSTITSANLSHAVKIGLLEYLDLILPIQQLQR